MGKLRALFERRKRVERDDFPSTYEGGIRRIHWRHFTDRADMARREADHFSKTRPLDPPGLHTEEVSLVLQLGDRDPATRQAAAGALQGRTLRDPDAALLLVRQLRDRDPERRRVAIQLLQGSALDHDDAAILLVDQLRDRDAEYREAARQALQGMTIGSTDAAAYLAMIQGD